jgi:Protein of unknown function (DUF2846)
MASEQQNAGALKFRTEPGKAMIYIYRQRSLVGGGDAYAVYLDGRLLGNNGPGTFLIGTVSPGPHVVSAGVSQTMLTATPGGIYFVRQTGYVGMSGTNNTTVRLVSSEEGKQGVRECKQAASYF